MNAERSTSAIINNGLQASEPDDGSENAKKTPQGSGGFTTGSDTEALTEAIGDRNLTFTKKIEGYRKELDAKFRSHEESLLQQSGETELAAMDWDDLQRRYEQEMSVKIAEEQVVADELSLRFKQFMLWMQVSNEREAERALKRLRTRVAFVQNSEEEHGAKQEHYNTVLEAFSKAMALLGNL